MAGSVQAPCIGRRRAGADAADRPGRDADHRDPITAETCRPKRWLALRDRWSSPASSTASSSTCNARVNSRCTRPVAARRPLRSVRRHACARPTGCFRSTARSAHSWCAASRPRRWARCGGARGTAGCGFTGNAARRSRSRSAPTACTPSGAAMAAQRLGEDSVTVAFLGDGATSEGDAHEALNLAAVVQGAVRVLRAEQPVGDLGAGEPPAGGAVDRAPRDRLRDARHPGRRQRRAGLLRGDEPRPPNAPAPAAARR